MYLFAFGRLANSAIHRRKFSELIIGDPIRGKGFKLSTLPPVINPLESLGFDEGIWRLLGLRIEVNLNAKENKNCFNFKI